MNTRRNMKKPRTRTIARQTHTTVLAAALLLAGCAVGPDYKRPALPASNGYAPSPLPVATAAATDGSGAQTFETAQDIRADWWEQFQSPTLDALIARAFARSPDLQAAQAALTAAQETVAAQRGYFYPTVQASYSPSRTRIATNAAATQGTPGLYTFHTAQLTVGFAPDVFGANRRQVEALVAERDAQALQLEAARVTLAGNLVAAAIQEAQLREQIAITQQVIDANQQSLDIVHRQQLAGYAAGIDVAVQESALAQARQQLPLLQKQLEQNRDLLRALVGSAQDAELPETFTLASLHLPATLPVTLPSRLVEQRPDVRIAEQTLHAASARVGVAEAARLPQFAIDGTWGGTASHFDQMFASAGQFFSLTGAITQPLFAGGTLRHQQRAAEADLQQAAAQYRSTVISAFRNVADSLQAVQTDADAYNAALAAEQASQKALDLMRRQFNGGYIDRLALIAAEQDHRQAAMNLAQARAMRLGDSAALFVALGGGWWHRPGADTAVLPADTVDASADRSPARPVRNDIPPPDQPPPT